MRSSVFDSLAERYDNDFSDRLPAQWLRREIRRRAARFVPRAGRALEIGCGTGDDAIWLAQQGLEVLATDVSGGMLASTRAKLDAIGGDVAGQVTVQAFDAASREMPDGPFDLLWSNFGALNCVPDLQPFLEESAARLASGGSLVLVVMGRYCVWEMFGFSIKGDLQRARRRWSGHAVYTHDGVEQALRFYTPSHIRRLAAPHFAAVELRGLGVFMPSTEFFRACEARPRLLRSCAALESRLGGWWPFNRLGDHFLLILRRR